MAHSNILLMGRSSILRLCRTLLWDILGTLLVSKSQPCPMLAFRSRLAPKVRRQVCKVSTSHETSSKIHSSSLQNKRFATDFLKKLTLQVCKTSASYETSSKIHASCLQSERFARDVLQNSLQNEHFVRDFLQKSTEAPSSNTRSHANPNVTDQTQP